MRQVDEGSRALVDFKEVQDKLVGGVSDGLRLDYDGGGGGEVLDIDHHIGNRHLIGFFFLD